MSDTPSKPPEATPPAGTPPPPTGRPSGSFPTITPAWRRFAKLWGFALFCALVAWWFRDVLLPFVFALGVAYILAPVVNRLSAIRIGRRRMPRGAAVLICYVVLLSVLALFFTAFLPRLSGDFARLGREAPSLWEKVNKEWTPKTARWLEKRFPSLKPRQPVAPEAPPGPMDELPPPPGTVVVVTPMANGDLAVTVPETGLQIERIDDKHVVVRPPAPRKPRSLEDLLHDRIQKALSGLEGQIDDLLIWGQALLVGTIAFIMKLVLVLMVAAFILIDLDRIHSFARGLMPKQYRDDYDSILAGIDKGLNGVIRGQLLICLVNGVLTWIGLMIFDIKYALLLAAVAAIMSLIPIFGSILSSIPIVAIAMVSGSEGVDLLRGLFMLAWILGIHFVEANFLNPKIIGSAAKMHPVLVIFALIAGEHTYGLVGALLAVPVASIIQTIFVFVRSRAWQASASSSAAPPPPAAPPPRAGA